MTLNVPFFIGLRYWRSPKANSFSSFITFFSVTGIFLGVTAMIIVSSVMNGFENQLKNRLLGAIPQVTLSQDMPFTHWQDDAAKLNKLDGVIGVIPNASTQAMAQSADNIAAIELYGIRGQDAKYIPAVSQHVFPGSFDDLKSGKYGVILGFQLASNLNVSIGDQVRFLSGKGVVYSPIGPIPSQRRFTVVGIFETGSQVDENIAYIDYKDARRLIRKKPSQVSELRLFVDDPFLSQQLESQIKQTLNNNIKVTDWRVQYGSFFSAVRMEKNMMSLMLSLIIIVAAFNIISALVMMVVDKTTDVAVLKTQGLSTSKVMGVFMVQGSLNALIGLTLGVITGIALSSNLNGILNGLGISILGPGQVLPVVIEWQIIAWIIIGTLSLSLLATLYPAMRAAKIQPANALRYE